MYEFDFAAPTSVNEAVALLSKYGSGAKILAGGTDLLAQLKENRLRPKAVIDIKRIPEANEMNVSAKAGLTVGAAVPCCRTYEDKTVKSLYPGLTDATSLVGSIQIQSRATLAGNLCNSSPAADTIPALIALGAVATIVGPNGKRKVPAEKFCTGPGKNVLKPGEFVLSLHLPAPDKNSGGFFLRFIPRNEMDIAVANAGAYVVLKDKDTIKSARLAVGAVAPTPLLISEANKVMAGQKISDELIEKVADLARKAANPITDMRGTVEQRVHLAGVLSKRALNGAIQRAKES